MAMVQMLLDVSSSCVDRKLRIAAFAKTTTYEAASSVGRSIFRRRPRNRRRWSIFDASIRQLWSVLEGLGVENSAASMSMSDGLHRNVSTHLGLSTKMFNATSRTRSGRCVPRLSNTE